MKGICIAITIRKEIIIVKVVHWGPVDIAKSYILSITFELNAEPNIYKAKNPTKEYIPIVKNVAAATVFKAKLLVCSDIFLNVG